MAKNSKKIKVLENRIEQLQAEMEEALTKKKHGQSAYDVPKTLKLIADLKKDIQKLQ